MKISLGIITFKDNKLLRKTIKSIETQILKNITIDEIFVISVFQERKKIISIIKDSSLKIIHLSEKKRIGKYNAINIFLENVNNNILVLCNGDVYLDKYCLEKLCLSLSDKKIGIISSKPIPQKYVSNPKFIEKINEIIWALHHQVSLNKPKFGEVIAFRNLGIKLPKTSVDEESLAYIISKKGYKKKYCPDAICYNKGPKNIKDLISQRKRIFSGHLRLRNKTDYDISTMKSFEMLRELLSLDKKLKHIILSIIFEGFSRIVGYLDFLFFKENVKWDIIERYNS